METEIMKVYEIMVSMEFLFSQLFSFNPQFICGLKNYYDITFMLSFFYRYIFV